MLIRIDTTNDSNYYEHAFQTRHKKDQINSHQAAVYLITHASKANIAHSSG